MISDTPLLEISFIYKGKERRIFAKAEYYNLSGSIKDRVAYYILKKAYESGAIHKGDTIVEATSGNTGIAFSAMAAYLGHPMIVYMPDWMSEERINLMKSYGADVITVSREEGGFLGSIAKCEEKALESNVFLPGQFSNYDNVEAHIIDTGSEILKQLDALGLVPDGVVAGVGTGGTIMGLSKAFKAVNPNCKSFPLEPLNSPTLSTGYKTGNHKIQGISDEFIPDIVKLDELDDIVAVNDIDSILMAKKLSRELGIGVGISSGANFLGAVAALEKIGMDKCVVTVFADDNKKYLSTDYSRDFDAEDDYISPQIELLSVKSYR
ncbi:MAG: PLP-dependent cysteine synthase family protein [Oscillospiraceae bacterium]|nr:PLP-dependent cysteine synthase family protein [Oscillospiraceae bacterium]